MMTALTKRLLYAVCVLDKNNEAQEDLYIYILTGVKSKTDQKSALNDLDKEMKCRLEDKASFMLAKMARYNTIGYRSGNLNKSGTRPLTAFVCPMA
jgi:hypothetical protein